MLVVLRLENEAYGMEVRREIETRTGRDASIGAVYATLGRLETKGLTRSHELAPEGEKGRPRRLYRVTSEGGRALERTQEAVASMWEGVTPCKGRTVAGSPSRSWGAQYLNESTLSGHPPPTSSTLPILPALPWFDILP